jgi:hypothetical protein
MPSNAILAPKQTDTRHLASMAPGGVSKADSVADDYLWRDTQDSSSAGQSETINMKQIDSYYKVFCGEDSIMRPTTRCLFFCYLSRSSDCIGSRDGAHGRCPVGLGVCVRCNACQNGFGGRLMRVGTSFSPMGRASEAAGIGERRVARLGTTRPLELRRRAGGTGIGRSANWPSRGAG